MNKTINQLNDPHFRILKNETVVAFGKDSTGVVYYTHAVEPSKGAWRPATGVVLEAFFDSIRSYNIKTSLVRKNQSYLLTGNR